MQEQTDVLPGRQAAFVARQNVIEIQLLALERFSAACWQVLLSRSKTLCRVNFTSFFGSRSKARSTMTRGTRIFHEMVVTISCSASGAEMEKVEPAREIMRRKVILLIGRDDLRVPLVEKRKGTTRRADVHRLPKAV